jgi:hypothetical protein
MAVPIFVWNGTAWEATGPTIPANPIKYQASAPSSPSTGDIWVDSDGDVTTGSQQFQRFRFVASGGETTISGNDANGATLAYTAGAELVVLNGSTLVRGQDYTATNGTSITGLSPALVASDVLEVFSFIAFTVANTYTQAQVDGLLTSYQTKAASGLVLLNTTNFTASTGVIVDDIFNATYNNYTIMLNISAVGTGDVDLRWYGRTTGGVDVTTNYVRERIIQYSTTITGSEAANSTFGSASGGYPTYANYQIDLFNPFVNSVTTLVSNGGYVTNAGVPYQDRIFSYNGASNIFTGFKIFPSASTITGSVSIYGRSK